MLTISRNSLTNFNKELVDTYLDVPYVETKCGYACSDHASFSKAGYPSSFTIGKAPCYFTRSELTVHLVTQRARSKTPTTRFIRRASEYFS